MSKVHSRNSEIIEWICSASPSQATYSCVGKRFMTTSENLMLFVFVLLRPLPRVQPYDMYVDNCYINGQTLFSLHLTLGKGTNLQIINISTPTNKKNVFDNPTLS